MTQTPIGIAFRTDFIRCCSDCFDKPFLIERMKASANNIKPIIVIDIVTKKAKCYLINDTLTDFNEVSDPILCRRIEGIANYMINKKNIQKSNLSNDDKEKSCDINVKMNYRNRIVNNSDKTNFRSILTRGNIIESR